MCKSRLSAEEFANSVGEERSNGEVRRFFNTLVTQNKGVSGLHQNSFTRILDGSIQINLAGELLSSEVDESIDLFRWAIIEEQFQRQYFFRTPVSTLQQMLAHSSLG